MILGSHQPDFAPYPGFFYKLYMSDVFVLSDDVAYSNSEMHKYNYIRFGDQKHRITIPVSAHADGKILREVDVAEDMIRTKKLLKTVEQAYRKAPFWNQYGNDILALLDIIPFYEPKLTQLNEAIIYWVVAGFGWETVIRHASQLNPKGRRDERLLDLCEKTGCDVYLSGWGAQAYHDPKKYEDAGVELQYTDYETLVYPQFGNGEFVENLSIIDYILNCGFQTPKEWEAKKRGR